MTSKWPHILLHKMVTTYTKFSFHSAHSYNGKLNQRSPHPFLSSNDLTSKICVHSERSTAWGTLWPKFKYMRYSLRKDNNFWDFHIIARTDLQTTFDLHFLLTKVTANALIIVSKFDQHPSLSWFELMYEVGNFNLAGTEFEVLFPLNLMFSPRILV